MEKIVKKLSELAALLEGELAGDDITISGVCAPDEQHDGSICIVGDAAYVETAAGGTSAAVVVSGDVAGEFGKPLIRTKKGVKEILVILLNLYYPKQPVQHAISPDARIASDATVGSPVNIGHFVCVGSGSSIGNGTVIGANTVIGDNVVVGENCVFHANVTVYGNVTIGNNVVIHSGAIIGCDGFGYLNTRTGHIKIPHVGTVIIGDDVEIMGNTVVDRGTLSATVIGEGTKIDNMCQISHNAKVGKHNIFAGHSGIAGSSESGDFVILGGGAGISDHVKVVSGAMFGGKAIALSDITEPGVYMGMPAMDAKQYFRVSAVIRELPELRKRLRKLEKESNES